MKKKAFVFTPVILALVAGCASENQKNFEGVVNRETKPRMDMGNVEEAQRVQTSDEEGRPVITRKNQIQKTIGVIDFSGTVNKSKSSQVIFTVREWLLTKRVREFIIYINSDGGDADASLAVYQSLKALPVSITTVNAGTVGSGAVWLYCAGSERYSMPNTSFMIHGSTTQNASINSDTQLEGYIKLYKKFYEAQKDILEDCSSMSKSLINEYIKSSDAKYLTVKEAKDFGITQKIGSPTLPLSDNVNYIFNWIYDKN